MVNITDLIALIRTLKEVGATHFKFEGIEVSFSQNQTVPYVTTGYAQSQQVNTPQQYIPPQSIQNIAPAVPYAPPKTEAEKIFEDRVRDVVKTINMKPEELADVIFPTGVEI